MSHAKPESEFCKQLGDAIVDGRFGEDPELWAPHCRQCERCSARVDGYFHLRQVIEESRTSGELSALAADAVPRTWESVASRYHQYQRRVRSAWGGVIVIAAAIVSVVLTSQGSGPMQSESAVTARELIEHVFRPDGTSTVDQLRTNVALERRFRVALTSPDPEVRRVAFMGLALARLPLDAAEIEELLRGAHPQLEGPVEVASVSGDARYMAAALERGRSATLVTVLGTLPVVLARQPAALDSGVLLPFLQDRDAEIRRLAIVALGFHSDTAPLATIRSALVNDPDVGVRIAAGSYVATRDSGESVARRLAGLADWSVEASLAPLLGHGPEATTLALRRIDDAKTPPKVALVHAFHLQRSGVDVPRAQLVERALATQDSEVAWRLALCAASGDWHETRAALQARWRSARGVDRTNLATALANWDVRVGTSERATLALEILADGENQSTRRALEQLTRSADPRIRGQAERIAQQWSRDVRNR